MSDTMINVNQAQYKQDMAYLNRLENELGHQSEVWWFLRDVTDASSGEGLNLSAAGTEGLFQIAKMMADRCEDALDRVRA